MRRTIQSCGQGSAIGCQLLKTARDATQTRLNRLSAGKTSATSCMLIRKWVFHMALFVERILTYNVKKLLVSIAAPTPRLSEANGWECRYQIQLEGDEASTVLGDATGEDALQALELAIDAAGVVVEKQFPEAYLYKPGDGCFFSYRVGQSLPYPYHLRLREHLRQEGDRKYSDLVDELVRSRQLTRRDTTDNGNDGEAGRGDAPAL
ncbi:MAG TPA: hypothetical protein VK324_14010 [Tepidisphaeraceae bacterium]|nr:hypothetical protein [Tepidisphaeraceae bacterium]